MGKRKLAASFRGTDHSTIKSCYSSEGIVAHLRGWDKGISIEMKLDKDDNPVFEIWTTGGSNDSYEKWQMWLTRTPTVEDFRNGFNK